MSSVERGKGSPFITSGIYQLPVTEELELTESWTLRTFDYRTKQNSALGMTLGYTDVGECAASGMVGCNKMTRVGQSSIHLS